MRTGERCLLCAAVTTAAVLASCGDGGGTAPFVYFPVEAGSSWEFEVSGTGTVLDSIEVTLEGTLDVSVDQEPVMHDSGFQVLEVHSEAVTFFDAGGGAWSDTTVELDTFYWRDLEGQVTEYDSLGDPTATLIHSPPIEVGQYWYPGPDEPGGWYEVTSTSETVTTPLDTFLACALVEHHVPSEGSYSEDYLAPGTGPVMIVATIDRDSIEAQLTYTLVSADPD